MAIGRRVAVGLMALPGLVWAEHASNPAQACPLGVGWEGFNAISLEVDGGKARVDLRVHTDGIAVRADEAGKRKELLELKDGWRLMKGVPPNSPLAFIGTDMAVGMPLYLLQYRFPSPCDTGVLERFEYDLGRGNGVGMQPAHVSGTVRRDGAVIAYEIRLDDAMGRGSRQLRGEWRGGEPLQPVVADMRIAGWDVYRQMRQVPAEALAPVRTLQQLRDSGLGSEP
jgi:hypothetical protein